MGEDFLFTDKQIQGPNDFKGGLSDNLYNNPVKTRQNSTFSNGELREHHGIPPIEDGGWRTPSSFA